MPQQGPVTRVLRKADVSVLGYTTGAAGLLPQGAGVSELVSYFGIIFKRSKSVCDKNPCVFISLLNNHVLNS